MRQWGKTLMISSSAINHHENGWSPQVLILAGITRFFNECTITHLTIFVVLFWNQLNAPLITETTEHFWLNFRLDRARALINAVLRVLLCFQMRSALFWWGCYRMLNNSQCFFLNMVNFLQNNEWFWEIIYKK